MRGKCVSWVPYVFHTCSTRVPHVFHTCSTRVPLRFYVYHCGKVAAASDYIILKILIIPPPQTRTICVKKQWNTCGTRVEHVWNTCGTRVEHAWHTRGAHTEHAGSAQEDVLAANWSCAVAGAPK